MADEYESVLLVVKECFVYRIPPRANARGHKASDWDVNSFLWKGRLRVVARGDKATINLEDSTSGELFATCPVEPDGNTVEPVLDSSRYFVLKIVDPSSGKHAFLGMGFPERSWAFDFNVALQDHAKQVQNQHAIESPVSTNTGPKADYSWKEGQTVSINIANMGKGKKRSKNDEGGDAIPFLPPPPSAKSVNSQPLSGALSGEFYQQQQQQQPQTQTKAASGGDEWADFGDFVAAPTASKSNTQAGWTTF